MQMAKRKGGQPLSNPFAFSNPTASTNPKKHLNQQQFKYPDLHNEVQSNQQDDYSSSQSQNFQTFTLSDVNSQKNYMKPNTQTFQRLDFTSNWEDTPIELDNVEIQQDQQYYKSNSPQKQYNEPNKNGYQNNSDPQLNKSESQMNENGYPDGQEPPLLEDLGIDPVQIKNKFLSILTQRNIKESSDYDDMAGPLLVLVIFGTLLLLRGKVHFGYIYGMGITGCLGIYGIINLLSKKQSYVELYKTFSILGYSLLPFVFLAFLSVFIDLNEGAGIIIAILVLGWSTLTATKFFEKSLEDMSDKKYLIAYPIALFYFVFMLLTLF